MRIVTIIAGVLLVALADGFPLVAAETPPVAAAEVQPRFFAVEITVGAKWDQSKQPHEQAFFKEHSANLRRLRESGVLVIGARYSDKGLVVVSANSELEVRTMLDEDPSFKAEVFKYAVHPFRVFYGGTLSPAGRM
jgi:hypothetical protein